MLENLEEIGWNIDQKLNKFQEKLKYLKLNLKKLKKTKVMIKKFNFEFYKKNHLNRPEHLRTSNLGFEPFPCSQMKLF